MSQQFPVPPPQYQPQYPQVPAQQIIVQQGAGANLSPTVTMGDWFILFILQCIPIVNIIMLIVFACDSSKPSRANFCKLSLIFMIIVPIIGIIIATICFGGLAAIRASMPN